jgi:serine/threonine-protein kinase
MPSATARALPFRVGRYECTQYLGGGMCDVYKAVDTQYGRAVVIKMLKEGAPADMRARFEREAKVSMKIQHENAMVTYDFSEHNGQLYLVLEYLEGQSLRVWMQQPHPTDEKLWAALQVARALEHLHSIDVVYRDLKPENVNVSSGNRVKLMDFGIARSADWGITEAGMAVGTAPYMAPEQVRGDTATAAVDIYAFGILLYELMTAKRPFEGGTYEEIFGQVLFSQPNLDALRETDAPKAVFDIVRTCLEKEIPKRFPSMKPVVGALQSCISDKFFTTQILGVEQGRKPRFPTAVVIGVILGLVVAAAAVYFLMHQKKKTLAAELHYSTGDMVLIPGGPARIGENAEAVDIPDFYIDKTEVSNRAYDVFCKQTGCTVGPGASDEPAVNVTYQDAAAFAKWAGKRLPAAQEWEKAARGTQGLRYPWGNIPDATRANVRDNAASPHRLMPVDSFPQGKSPYGVLNLYGNAWEWTSTLVQPSQETLASAEQDKTLNPPLRDTEPWYAVKGSSFERRMVDGVKDDDPVPIWEVAATPGRVKSPDIGFRCAKDPR